MDLLPVLLVLSAILACCCCGRRERFKAHAEKSAAVMGELQTQLSSKFKITVAFFQIVLLVGGVYEVMWPTGFLDFLANFSFFEFDFLQFFRIACVVQYNEHTVLYWLGSVLVCLEGITIIGLLYVGRKTASAAAPREVHALDTAAGAADASRMPRAKQTAAAAKPPKGKTKGKRTRVLVGYILLLTYVIYPLACKKLFGIFNCIEVDGKRYLLSDLNIDCRSTFDCAK